MTRSREWPMRAMYILIAAALALSLFITVAPTHKVSAADNEISKWTRVPTPTTEDWVLAPESIIYDYALASGGDVAYAVVDSYFGDRVGDFFLLKSTDGAATWTDITDALDDVDTDETIDQILQVATDWVDPDFVAVALRWLGGELHVYISNDAGATFDDAGRVIDDTIVLNTVSDLAVSLEADGKRDMAIGGMANTIGGAGIFRSTVTGDSASAWEDATAFDGWDDNTFAPSWIVTDIIFSPSWATDKTILVTTVADGYYVYLQCGTWGTASPGWNDHSTLSILAVPIIENVNMPTFLDGFDARGLAGIALPSNYNSKSTETRVLWVWVNYFDPATDDPASVIMRVDNDSADPVVQQIKGGDLWLTNVSYYGTIAEGKAIAGVLGTGTAPFTDCVPVEVYRNTTITNMDICCQHWEKACKPPTGAAGMAVSYVSADKAYAVAIQGDPQNPFYDEGAWSVSFDDGNTWNQLSLVDTNIDYLADVARSPDCNKTWIISINVEDGCALDSVWLRADNLPEAEEYSGKWLRVWNGDLEDNWGLLRLPLDETAGENVFLVEYDYAGVWMNDLEGLGCWTSISSTTLNEIVDLVAKDATTLFALDYNGEVSMYDDQGWHDAVDSKVDYGYTIAVHGDWVLVGGEDGDVSYSDDGGETFTELEEVPTIEGYVTVAFDSYFDTNDVIYAATDVDDVDGGVYRWVIGTDDSWTNLNAAPVSTFLLTGEGSETDLNNLAFTGLVVDRPSPSNPMTSNTTGGVLYASYTGMLTSVVNNVTVETWVTGVARMLEPGRQVVCSACRGWDYLHVGLTPGELPNVEIFEATPHALKICGCLTADSHSRLYAIDEQQYYDMDDAEEGAVWTFEDCSSKTAPDLVSPAEAATVAAAACNCKAVPFVVNWDRLCDYCEYDIEIALDAGFTQIIASETFLLPDDATNPSFYVTQDVELAPGATYYWRARGAEASTTQIIHSWWSDGRSFSVAPSAGAGVTLNSPAAGAADTATTKIGFTWTAVTNADKYDWVLSANPDLSAPIATKTGLTTTATSYTGAALAYDTPYYWQVKAYKNNAVITMSTIGTFRTAVQGAFCSAIDGQCFATQAELNTHNAELQAKTAPTPFWVWVVIAIGAILVIVVIVLIFRTRRV